MAKAIPFPVTRAGRRRQALRAEPPPEFGLEPDESPYAGTIRWLIWAYLFLWLVEGALRKWYLPSLSNPLLVIRDPIVVLIYMAALAGNLFPFNRVVVTVIILGAFSFLAGWLVTGNLLMTVYGYRSNFLHLPLIYIMARVLRPADLRQIGFFLLASSLPMAVIMARQFQSDYDSWWNLGAGGGRQIISVDGRIRAAGTFSFISGPVAFFGMVVAFLISAVTLRKWFRWWLVIPATASTILAAAVAGSRALLAVLVLGALVFFVGCLRFPKALRGVGALIACVVLAFPIVGFLDVYKTGKGVTTERATGATQNEGGISGFLYRIVEPMLITPDALLSYNILGRGLGTGTVAANALARGVDDQPVWAENEWSRVLLESGPVLGLTFIILRLAMLGSAFSQSLSAAGRGNLLPIALFGAALPGLLVGQFGQPTSQGAAVIATGLCLGALSLRSRDTAYGRESDDPDEPDAEAEQSRAPESETGGKKVRRGRAPFAEMLHRK